MSVFDAFQTGAAVGKRKAPFSGVMENFQTRAQNEAKLQGELGMEVAKQKIKNEYGGNTNVYSFNPLTGDFNQVSTVPKGSVVRNELGPEDLKQKAEIQQEAQVSGKSMEQGAKIGTAAKRLKIFNKQINDAVQTSDNPFVQRISGPAQVLGAKTGLVPNPRLMAIKKNSRPLAIQMIRAFGEVGNLSEPEQKSALDVVSQENLTHEERLAVVKQFAEFALAGARPEAVNYMIKDPDVSQMVKDYGIQIGQQDTGVNRADVAPDASNTSNVDIEKEKRIVAEKIASGKYDPQKLMNIFKQKTGQDYNG